MTPTRQEWQRTCETLNRIQRIGLDEEAVARVAEKCFRDARREENAERRNERRGTE
jgi:hypothetical protein